MCAELRDLLSLFLLRRQKEGVFTGERALPDKCELLGTRIAEQEQELAQRRRRIVELVAQVAAAQRAKLDAEQTIERYQALLKEPLLRAEQALEDKQKVQAAANAQRDQYQRNLGANLIDN